MKYIFLIMALVLGPYLATADTVTITNSVTSEASTGSNSASAGQLTEGGSRSEVKVHTEVNGEVVEDFRQVKVGNPGEPLRVEFENKKRTDSALVETKATTKVNGVADLPRPFSPAIDGWVNTRCSWHRVDKSDLQILTPCGVGRLGLPELVGSATTTAGATTTMQNDFKVSENKVWSLIKYVFSFFRFF